MEYRIVGFPLALLAFLVQACINESNPPVDNDPRYFPREVEGLDSAVAPATLELEDGDTLRLEARPVRKVLAGREVRMLSYNGSTPGPFLRVPQGASIVVLLVNRTGMETDLYFHGVRTAGQADAGPPIADGDSLAWSVSFPDAGSFWYHSRIREDYAREMGLYGGVLVAASDSALWREVNREVPVLLDDILLDDTGMVPHRLDEADHAVLGRYGNVYLANGEVKPVFEFRRKEVVRFFVTNACVARPINFGLRTLDSSGVFLGRDMKIVGFDNGPIVQPYNPYSELFAPGERFAFEVFLEDTVTLYLTHILAKPDKPQEHTVLAVFRVSPDSVDTDYGADFYQQSENAAAAESIRPFEAHFGKSPDREILIAAREKRPIAAAAGPLGKIAHDPGSKGIVWEDTLGGVNRATTSDRLEWFFRDLETGKENGDIAWTFARGSAPKIRIYNLPAALFPTPQSIHFGGQRFMVVAEGGVRPFYFGWRDTYLVGRGEVIDLILDASNAGTWTAGTTIAERTETGMRFAFTVE
jgi:FtsP/CotA-like multicopper oxidase with cupredoxin domain